MNLGFPDTSECEGSQSDSSSDDFGSNVSRFLKAFQKPPILMGNRSGYGHAWVFCSQSENNSSLVDVGAPVNIIHDKIISAFSNIYFRMVVGFAQFWAPVTIGDRLLLSNCGQPFAVTDLLKDLVKYRVDSEKYKYIIDLKNKLHVEGDPMMSNGGPATAYLNRFPYTIVPLEENDDESRRFSLMLPVCFPFESSCVGVLELTTYHRGYDLGKFVLNAINEIKDAGLDVCNVQERMPYKTINGLRPAEDEIKHALQIVCRSHKLSLAQVWIGVKDESHVPLSSYLEDTQRVFGLKLTGYLHHQHDNNEYKMFKIYNRFCDIIPLGSTHKHALKTLQDFKSCYISTLKDDVLLYWKEDHFMASSLVICLRSIDTGDFNFVFEFTWLDISRCDIFLEALLLTLKRCLPSFKFACGAELGDELDVIEVDCSEYKQTHTLGILPAYNEICNFKIFQGKPSSPIPKTLEVGKQPTVVDYIAPSEKITPEVSPLEDIRKHLDVIGGESPTRGETSNIMVVQGKRSSPICKSAEEETIPIVKSKTAKILLTQEDIEKQFDKTMEEAKTYLKVFESTLKCKAREHGILEWPKTKPMKRNKKDLSINQMETNEEYNGADQEPSKMTIKVEYAGCMIKSCLLISQATFETVVKEVGVKFKLSLGTYGLTYLDEDGDWISLTSDEELSDCIKSSRKSNRILVRLRVLPSTNIQI